MGELATLPSCAALQSVPISVVIEGREQASLALSLSLSLSLSLCLCLCIRLRLRLARTPHPNR